MYSLSYQLAADQLRTLSPDYKVIVLHPNYAQQHLCFSTLLEPGFNHAEKQFFTAGQMEIRFSAQA